MASVITRTGKSVWTNLLKKTGEEPKVVCWGLNPAVVTAAATDIAMFEESAEARTAGASSLATTTFTNDTYQVVGTQTATGSREIKEAGLSNSTTKPFKTEVKAASGVIGSNSSTELKLEASYTPANKTFIQIRGEVMKVESGEGTATVTVQRGQNGSTASSAIAAKDAVTLGNIPGPYSLGAEAPTTGATLVCHADLAVVSLSSGDSIQWTWNVTFS
jgi:hypothetical protein